MIKTLYSHFISSTGVCTDTRNIIQGSIFFALKGENFNGNNFAVKAIKSGAQWAVIDEDIPDKHPNIIVVNNVLQTLQQLANHHRKTLNLPIFALTGSNGKTTTKELINAILSKKYNVYATKGNLNNHIGVPLSLLNINASHDMAIIEMGANKPGDIEELCEITYPNVGLITNIGKAHLEGFGNYEGVKRTKSELYKHINKHNGTVIVNTSDSTLMALSETFNRFLYNNETIKGSFISSDPYIKFKWSYNTFRSNVLNTHMIGSYNYHNMMAAVAVGIYFKVDPIDISNAIQSYTPDNNRSEVIRTPAGHIVIKDAYNANPTSMKAALENFSNMSGQKICILGDMLELGPDGPKEHQSIITLLEKLQLDAILVGPLFNSTRNAFNCYPSIQDLMDQWPSYDGKADTILLKGSRGLKLENITPLIS